MEISASLLAIQVNYTRWASNKLLTFALTVPEADLTRHIGNSHGDVLNTFQHTYYADRVWYSRLNGSPRQGADFADPAPGPSLTDLDREWWPLLTNFEQLARDNNPCGILRYQNLKGETFERSTWQTILHVVNHGTYHRGQIASMLRQQGHQPPSTDLIYYYLEQ